MQRTASFIIAIVLSQSSIAADFTDSVSTDEGVLSKCSQTEISVMKFIDVADAALYSSDCQQLPVLADDVQLSFIYHREIAAEDFIEAAETLLRRNLSASDYQQIEREMESFNAGYESVAEGDRYDIRRSNAGLALFKNQRLVSQHPSDRLGERYYAIWFGDNPFNQKLKQDLLQPDN